MFFVQFSWPFHVIFHVFFMYFHIFSCLFMQFSCHIHVGFIVFVMSFSYLHAIFWHCSVVFMSLSWPFHIIFIPTRSSKETIRLNSRAASSRQGFCSHFPTGLPSWVSKVVLLDGEISDFDEEWELSHHCPYHRPSHRCWCPTDLLRPLPGTRVVLPMFNSILWPSNAQSCV